MITFLWFILVANSIGFWLSFDSGKVARGIFHGLCAVWALWYLGYIAWKEKPEQQLADQEKSLEIQERELKLQIRRLEFESRRKQSGIDEESRNGS